MKGDTMFEKPSKQIADKWGKAYLLRQLAEECGELTQAALKLVRVYEGTTPVSEEEALNSLAEELADVQLMIDYVSEQFISGDLVLRMIRSKDYKARRMFRRLIGGDMSS